MKFSLLFAFMLIFTLDVQSQFLVLKDDRRIEYKDIKIKSGNLQVKQKASKESLEVPISSVIGLYSPQMETMKRVVTTEDKSGEIGFEFIERTIQGTINGYERVEFFQNSASFYLYLQKESPARLLVARNAILLDEEERLKTLTSMVADDSISMTKLPQSGARL